MNMIYYIHVHELCRPDRFGNYYINTEQIGFSYFYDRVFKTYKRLGHFQDWLVIE